MNIGECSIFPLTTCDSVFLDALTAPQALPTLPFDDDEFDLALCSHFLFLYSAQLSEDFHVTAIRDMTRVAREVRIFPLLALGAARSPHLDGVSQRLRDGGLVVTIETVPYEFQRNGNQMMRVRSAR